MQAATLTGWMAVFFLIFFFAFDVSNIGTSKIVVNKNTKSSAQTAMVRSVEEGGIRVKRRPRIDVEMFKEEWKQAVQYNAGSKVKAGENGTTIYAVDRLKPYTATKIRFPVESLFLRHIKEESQGFKQHHMVFIWDEKK